MTNPKLDEILAAIKSLQTKLNALRADFRAHDHEATYAATQMRINAGADTISGTETSAAASDAVPDDAVDCYQQD